LTCSIPVEDKISTGGCFSQGKRGGKRGRGKGKGKVKPFKDISKMLIQKHISGK